MKSKFSFAGLELATKIDHFEKEQAAKELELATKIDHFEKERAAKKMESDRAFKASEVAEYNKHSIEQDRIEVELKRLGASDNDAYLSATRFVHEQQVAEAELVRSFSDRLLSENERERAFALFVLSAYVSPDVIRRLAAGGEDIISNASLEKISTLDGYEISDIAKSILARRATVPKHDSQPAVGASPVAVERS